MEKDNIIMRYNNDVGLYDYINPTINLKDLNRKQVKELAKEIADGKGLYSWQEVDNNNVEYNSKNNRQEKRFKRIFNKQLNQNLAPILEKQHKQELIDRMKSGDASAMSQYTTEGINKFGHQFMPVMLTAATLPFGIGAFGQSINTLGLIPAIGAEAGSWGLGYGGYKLGEKLDDSFGTNWIAPVASIASGIGGYGAGYKGMVKLGSKGWLPKGDKFMYGSQFVGDVATDAFKKNVKTFNIDAAVDSARKLETMQKLRNSGQTLNPYYQAGVDQNIVPDDLPEYILPLSQLKQDYPKAQLVPLGKQTNVWSLDGNPLVSGKNVGYDHPLRGTQHRVLKIGNKQYYVGTDPVKNQGSNILIHQGDLPMSGSKVAPIEGDTGITKIWWEQNAPFYGKIDAPKAKAGTYVIDDVIPTEYALERSGIFGSKHSVLSDEVNLADPKTNFRFFTYDPISGEIVQSPFVFPKNNSTQGNVSYKFFERPSKLTIAERVGIPKGDRANLTQDQLEGVTNQYLINKAFKSGKLRYGQPTSYTAYHQSATPITKFKFPFKERWDVRTHGADPNGAFFTAGEPASAGFLAERPYTGQFHVKVQKPLIQTGELSGPTKNGLRNAIVRRARQDGADAVFFNGIADNQLKNQQILFATDNADIGYRGMISTPFKQGNWQLAKGVRNPSFNGKAQIMWMGPTAGKTTYAKINPNVVDIDPLTKGIRKQVAKNLGLDFKDPKVSTSIEYQEAIVDMVNNWLRTPSNRGKTLVASTKHLLDPKYKIKFANEPFIPDFETFVARNQARGFRETPEQLRKWYDSILEIKPNIKIDNRFTSEILNGQ